MTEYLKPEDMDTVQKMKYMSIVSKVCKELDTHLELLRFKLIPIC